MSWNQDNHGILFKSNELKLYSPSHTWAMKLSQLHKQQGEVRILTYSLPFTDDVIRCLRRAISMVTIICHSKFEQELLAFKEAIGRDNPHGYEFISTGVNDKVHSKVVCIEPATLYIGSANFGNSHWHETTIGVRSKEAHDWFVLNEFNPLLSKSPEPISNNWAENELYW